MLQNYAVPQSPPPLCLKNRVGRVRRQNMWMLSTPPLPPPLHSFAKKTDKC